MALTILSLIVLTSYQLLKSVIEAKVVLDQNREATFIGNSILTRLTRELQLAEVGRPLLQDCSSSSSSAPSSAPATGPAPTTTGTPAPTGGTQINLIGEEKSIGLSERGDSITFLAREGGQYVPDGGTHSGVVQITYRVEKDPDQPDSNSKPSYLLIRDEMPYRKPVSKACADAIRFPISKDVLSLEFSYYDKKSESWQNEWGTGKFIKLPQMIQFKLKLKGPEDTVRIYTTAVAVRGG